MKQHAFKWARRFWACMFCSVFAVSLLAVPARREWRTVPQADGTTIEVMVLGDEFYHYTINREGKQVREVDGMYQVVGEAPTAEIAKARRAAIQKKRNSEPRKIGASSMPARALFILVSFSDVSFKEASANYYKSKLGDQTEGALSMYNYLKQQSNGKYAPPVDVFGPITMSKSYSYYGSNDDAGNDLHPAEMIVEACKALDSEIDFSLYDANNDGTVDNVYVLYAGKGEADGGNENTIWPHQWDIWGQRLSCKLDGKNIRAYACSAELNGSNKCAMGTPLHEFGHVIGLPDYYDTEYESTNYTESRTPGEWSIMDQGSYNNDGNTPPNYSIFDKYFLGWVTPNFLAKDAKETITLTTKYGDGYQITGGSSLVAYSNTNTVYYIENRQKEGWDEYLPGHGMIVWKVKYNSSDWENNVLNNTGGSPRYTVQSASGDPTNIGKTSDPFPGSKVVRNYTPFTGCAITDIAETDGVITFKYNGGKTQCSYELLGEHCTVPADGTVAINSALSLTITPDAGYVLNDAECWTVEMGTGNELVYGQGFTYNATTNEFRIEKVTDDVVILVEGKVKADPVPCTIRFFNNGQQIGDDQVVLQGQQPKVPANPEACNDYSFAGWYTATLAVDNTKKPAYVEDFTVTEAKDYYAVFTLTEIGEGEVAFDGTTGGTFKIYAQVGDVKYYAKAYDKKIESTTDIAEAADYVFEKVDDGFAIKYGDKYIKYGTSGTDFSTSNDAYTWTLGTAVKGSWRLVASSADTRSFVYRAGTVNKFAPYASSNITANGTEYFDIEIGGSGASSITYYTTAPDCSTPEPCVLTGIELNTENVDKEFLTGAEFNYTGLVVTAQYNNCDGKTVTPTSVSTPDMSTAGKKTVTVTYEENEVSKEASYEITVNDPATYIISFYNNGSLIGEAQQVTEGQEPEIPADPAAGCTNYTFYGWYTEPLAKDNTEKPAKVEDFKAVKDQNYYAVFIKTETSEGGEVAFDGTTGGTFKIYAQVGDVKYYAKAYDKKIESTTDIAEAADYVFEKVDDGFAIKYGDKYIKYGTSGTDFSTSNDAYTWTLGTAVKGSWRLVASSANTRSFVYRAGTVNKFAPYAFSNIKADGNEYFDLEIGGGSSSITYYSTIVNCVPTNVQNIQNDNIQCTKVIRDGQLYILYNGCMYDVRGARIK